MNELVIRTAADFIVDIKKVIQEISLKGAEAR
jgi:hypothetical protein